MLLCMSAPPPSTFTPSVHGRAFDDRTSERSTYEASTSVVQVWHYFTLEQRTALVPQHSAKQPPLPTPHPTPPQPTPPTNRRPPTPTHRLRARWVSGGAARTRHLAFARFGGRQEAARGEHHAEPRRVKQGKQ